MSHQAAQKILEGIIKAWAATKSIPVAYHGVKFTPVADQMYIQPFLIPAINTNEDLALKTQMARGRFQINFMYPYGVGAHGAGKLINELSLGVLRSFTTVSEGQSTLQITSAFGQCVAAYADKDRLVVPADLQYTIRSNI